MVGVRIPYGVPYIEMHIMCISFFYNVSVNEAHYFREAKVVIEKIYGMGEYMISLLYS
jgi:hypothetical protein